MADPSETTQVSREPTEQDAELVDAVRALAAQVGSLQDELHALRTETRAALPPSEADDTAGTRCARSPCARALPGSARSIRPELAASPIPWLLLEILFLVAVAVLCVVAGLDAPVIAGVMVVAWVLVALGEWLAVARRARPLRTRLRRQRSADRRERPDDRSWFEHERRRHAARRSLRGAPTGSPSASRSSARRVAR